ncbi:GNAT family N-acetyltransferase [Terrimonas sp. NA20]|uniref:GNAT family N-acetyltransferase n=1 Tax=Terrimonas ginsenosidimutans TaxID=2908004 RepID=A0ABS9L022_9BACT|nr:GNAT family N-acetyltransferase [Terrimonas ginsenosidimutans]MCG2617937.1 GNAT family N-acetyltransferase [Terrimonas ginsenosidimutans]
MKLLFRKAEIGDLDPIWEILQQAIERRRLDGSNQWQDGYPNPDVVRKDIDNRYGFVLTENNTIVGYCAILINDEPEYANIKGKWLTNGDFVVYHRVAISENHLGKGLAQEMLRSIEQYALDNHINSLKADTNFDNAGMLRIFEKMGYVYCGEVTFRGSPRKAFEKVLAV